MIKSGMKNIKSSFCCCPTKKYPMEYPQTYLNRKHLKYKQSDNQFNSSEL